MIIHSHTEPGGKLMNEDCLLVRPHPLDEGVYLLILADGQGGSSKAAEASRVACESVWRLASQIPFDQLCRDGEWEKILRQTDVEVSLTGGFTTLIAIALDRDFASGASSGDSKVFFMPSSPRELGEWTHRQRKNPPVGSGEADFVPFMSHAIGGGRLLILSDGAWKYCGYEALRGAFDCPLSEVSSLLRNAIVQRSGLTLPDDLSIIVVEVE